MTTRLTRRLLTAVVAALLFVTLPAAAGVATDYESITYPDLPEFDIPQPETFTLGNGMKVFLMRDTELPLISVTARVRTGSNYDPADKTGLGGLVGQVQREGGTTSMSGDEIDDFLAARAASVETSMGGDIGFASMNCLTEDFKDVLRVFADVLRNPVFSEDKLEVAKAQAKAGIARRNDSIAGVAGREFSRLIYGPDSALGRMVEYATLANVERQDLVDWHAKYYHPNNVYLGVSGDFDPKTIRKTLEAVFGDWKRGPAFSDPEPAIADDVEPGVYFIEKDDVTQAYVRLGHQGITMDNPDYHAVQVMNEVFGGGFSARLFSRVRSDKGLAYSVGGGVGASFARPGVFQVALSTKSGTMAESVDALMEEVQNIITDPPSAAELARAKESILNSFVFNYTSAGQILGQQLTYAYYGLPADFLEQYRTKIEKVTTEDVARVAQEYIHPDKMAVLVVGRPADFDRPVSTFGEVTELDITIPDPPDDAPELEMTSDNLEKGSALLAKAARALNGDAGPVRTLRSDVRLELSLAGQTMGAGQTTSVQLPDKMRQAFRLPMGEQVVVVNGDRGYAAGGGQRQDLGAEQIAEALQGVGRELSVIAGNLDDADMQAVAAGSDSVNGTACEIVAVSFMGGESRLCVAADGRVLRQRYQGRHPVQGPGVMEVTFSDWRDVDGRTLPFARAITFEGQPFASATVTTYDVNPTLDPAEFEVE